MYFFKVKNFSKKNIRICLFFVKNIILKKLYLINRGFLADLGW